MSGIDYLGKCKGQKSILDEIPVIRTHNQIGQSNANNVSFRSYLEPQKRVSSQI
jgi:hypothetical protein